ncbi:MAG: hypothetical protein HFI34_01105 [Lachnospiraceae bacterium]|nr:hypothetical protein [Lachnospiraceae bacterium]
MKKFKRTLSLLMMSAMLILPISIPAQAKEITDGSNDITNIAPISDINYATPAIITEDNVAMKDAPGLAGTVLMTLQRAYFIQIDKANAIESDGILWYPCKYGYVYGYVAAEYVKIVGQ